MYMIRDPLAKERAIMNALAKGDKALAQKLSDELSKEDKEWARSIVAKYL